MFAENGLPFASFGVNDEQDLSVRLILELIDRHPLPLSKVFQLLLHLRLVVVVKDALECVIVAHPEFVVHGDRFIDILLCSFKNLSKLV